MRRAPLTLVAVLLAAVPAGAVNFFELEVYPATTEGQGIHEVESTTTFVANGRSDVEGTPTHRLLRTSLEYNYGLTDKIDIAAYTDLERPNGEEVEYAGSRVRAHGAFWEQGRFPVDVGWYMEAEMPHGEASDLELEFKPLLSRDFGRFSLDLNPIFELPTVTTERRTLEFGYAARVYYRLAPNIAPGVEFYGTAGQIRRFDPSQEQEHYVFPVVYARLPHGVRLVAGPGFGLTRGSDPVVLKFAAEYEFTLGGGVVPGGRNY